MKVELPLIVEANQIRPTATPSRCTQQSLQTIWIRAVGGKGPHRKSTAQALVRGRRIGKVAPRGLGLSVMACRYLKWPNQRRSPFLDGKLNQFNFHSANSTNVTARPNLIVTSYITHFTTCLHDAAAKPDRSDRGQCYLQFGG